MIDNRIASYERSKRVDMFRARVAVVFERLPMLCGFHVTEDLSLTEVTVHGWSGSFAMSGLMDEICAVLEELVLDDAAETAELLRGRTFARALH